jgi:hypothetical protein
MHSFSAAPSMIPSYIEMPPGSAIVRVAKAGGAPGIPKAGGGKRRAFRASVRSDNDSETEEAFFQSEATAYVGNE